mmetsp:Transcript_35513/g.47025  ORF Transcript_35513/g.47025 Transcript_35513/m.47025 type:complete len:117 (-) Transcript_35513:64-414(-)
MHLSKKALPFRETCVSVCVCVYVYVSNIFHTFIYIPSQGPKTHKHTHTHHHHHHHHRNRSGNNVTGQINSFNSPTVSFTNTIFSFVLLSINRYITFQNKENTVGTFTAIILYKHSG